MADASKQRSWTSPAAMAIPKGGFFKDKAEQGSTGANATTVGGSNIVEPRNRNRRG
jgi:hypothetical protein